MATIGSKIKELRLQQKLSLGDVGRACGVAKSTIMHWEEGTDVRGEKLIDLANTLHTTVDYLIGSTDNSSASLEEQIDQPTSFFDILLRQAGIKEVATTDGDRILIIDGLMLQLDPEIIDEVSETTTEFFAFLLKRKLRK